MFEQEGESGKRYEKGTKEHPVDAQSRQLLHALGVYNAITNVSNSHERY